MSTCKRMWTDRQIRSMAVDSVENKEDLKVFENIVDKDGHKRFIEGDITPKAITGVTYSYGKWSLSGSHLMIVIAGTVANATVIDYEGVFASIPNIPDWVKAKINPGISYSGTLVEAKSVNFYGDDASTQNGLFLLRKNAVDGLYISFAGLTLTKERYFRAQFDLLIDNE